MSVVGSLLGSLFAPAGKLPNGCQSQEPSTSDPPNEREFAKHPFITGSRRRVAGG